MCTACMSDNLNCVIKNIQYSSAQVHKQKWGQAQHWEMPIHVLHHFVQAKAALKASWHSTKQTVSLLKLPELLTWLLHRVMAARTFYVITHLILRSPTILNSCLISLFMISHINVCKLNYIIALYLSVCIHGVRIWPYCDLKSQCTIIHLHGWLYTYDRAAVVMWHAK